MLARDRANMECYSAGRAGFLFVVIKGYNHKTCMLDCYYDVFGLCDHNNIKEHIRGGIDPSDKQIISTLIGDSQAFDIIKDSDLRLLSFLVGVRKAVKIYKYVANALNETRVVTSQLCDNPLFEGDESLSEFQNDVSNHPFSTETKHSKKTIH